MPVFKLPLSGDVVQSISPMTWWASPVGSQFGLVNINLGQSTDPEIEADVLTDVASYGKQIGRILDALDVLLRHLPPGTEFHGADKAAIDGVKEIIAGVEKVKARRAHKKETQRV